MNVRITSEDIDAVIRELRGSREAMRKTNEQLVKTMVNQASVELANATNPPFFDERFRVDQQFAINAQVNMAFPRAGWIYKLIEVHLGKDMADQWWAIQKNDPESADRWIAEKGLPVHIVSPSNALHRQARTGPKGKVVKWWDDRHAKSKEELAVFSERKQENAGIAKAGWIKAGEVASGGKSRVGGKSVGWVRKLVKKASGTGSMKYDDVGWGISLVNLTPWANDAQNERLMATVPNRLSERFKTYCKTVIRNMAKQLKMSGQD